MMSLWDALRMNMMISYQELVRTFLSEVGGNTRIFRRVIIFIKPGALNRIGKFIIHGDCPS